MAPPGLLHHPARISDILGKVSQNVLISGGTKPFGYRRTESLVLDMQVLKISSILGQEAHNFGYSWTGNPECWVFLDREIKISGIPVQ